MTLQILILGVDLLMLIGLGVFVFFALKLSRSLDGFRSHRDTFNQTMIQLSQQIEQAQQSVKTLASSSDTATKELSGLVSEARQLADEMQLINESGNSLASRLEGLAERSRIRAERDGLNRSSGEYVDNVKALSKQLSAGGRFSIQDQDFDDENMNDYMRDDDVIADDYNDPEFQNLSSAAERELYKALQKNKKVRV